MNLVAPEKPGTKSLEDLIQMLQDHFEPKTLEIAETQKFIQRRQNEGESVSDYMSDLKPLSLSCNFGTHLDRALRDQFISGLRNSKIKEKLITQSQLNWSAALALAQQMEAVQRDLPIFHPATAPVAAIGGSKGKNQFNSGKQKFNSGAGNSGQYKPAKNSVAGASGGQKGKAPPSSNFSLKTSGSCHRCGDPNHWAPQCPHKNKTCNKCGQKGHFSNVCGNFLSKSGIATVSDIGTVAVICGSSGSDEILVSASISRHSIQLLLDTGAKASLLNANTWRLIGSPKLISTSMQLRSTAVLFWQSLGNIQIPLTVEGITKTAKLYIVNNYGSNIFGRDLLGMFRLDWNKIFAKLRAPADQVNSITLTDILREYPELFFPELGHVKDVHAHVEFRQDATPKFFKPRPVPFALRSKIEDDLDRLQRMGVIEPILRSDYAAPIVPVQKPDGSIRICGDFRLTINPVIQADWYPLPTSEELFATLAGCKVFSKHKTKFAFL